MRTLEFFHPILKSTVRIIGISHFGEARYFREVIDEARALERQGYTVHYEGVPSSKSKPKAKSLPGNEYGIVHQSQFYTEYEESWENHDIPREHLTKTGAFSDDSINDSADKITYGTLNHVMGVWIVKDLYRKYSVFRTIAYIASRFPGQGIGVILGHRNSIAIHAVINQVDPGKDFCLLWGADHISGMKKLLLGFGFQEVPEKSEWRTVLTLKRLQ